MKKATYLTLSMLAVCLMAGCAAKTQVLVDGMPMPNTTYVSKSQSTEIRVEAYMSSLIVKRDSEKDDPYLYPVEYLDIGVEGVHKLDPKTLRVGGKVRVVNPLRKTFSVKVFFKIHYPDEDWPLEISQILYKGKSHDKTFNVSRKTESSCPLVELRILVYQGDLEKEEDSIADMRLSYKVRNN